MKPFTTSAELKMAIQQLELRQAEELMLLKETFEATKENLRPINLIKDAFNEAVDLPDLKTDILNAAIGLATGFVTKKLILGKTLNPLSKLLGSVLEIFVANKVTKNAEDIKTTGAEFIGKLFKRKEQGV